MKSEYVICIKNKGYEASLELKKIYQIIDDAVGRRHSQIRVIDESGEDYLYPKDFFAKIKVPKAVKQAF